MCRRRLKQAGWTGYTYALWGFLFTLFAAVTVVATSANPKSQLSLICCVIWIVYIAAAGVALRDRRNR